MTITYTAGGTILGLSTDTKPTTNVLVNTLFFETDTVSWKVWNGTAWTRGTTKAKGLSTAQNGNGSTTIFNIAHGCSATPTFIMVQPATADARGNFSISVTSSNVVITYAIAPPSGTSNLQWFWEAEVYT